MHIICSHCTDHKRIQSTIVSRNGDFYNGTKIMPQFIISMALLPKCIGCQLSRTRKRGLRKKRQGVLTMEQITDDAPDEEEEPTQLDIDAPPVTEHEFRAAVPGVENSAFVLQNSHLRPGEMVFFDAKPYLVETHGGYKHCFLAVDAATSRVLTIDMRNKKATGLAMQYIICDWGLHKLDYKCTVCCDGCGSNKHAIEAASRFGLDHKFVPPFEQSLNLAEHAIKLVFDSAGATMALLQHVPAKFFRQAVHTVVAQNNLMALSGTSINIMQAWNGNIPEAGELVPFGTIMVLRKTTAQNHSSQNLSINRDGTLQKTVPAVSTLRGQHGIFIGYAHQSALSSKKFLKYSEKDTQSVVTTRSYLQPQFPLGFKQQHDQTSDADNESDEDSTVTKRPPRQRRKTRPQQAAEADADDDDFSDEEPDQNRSNAGVASSSSSDPPSSSEGSSSSTTSNDLSESSDDSSMPDLAGSSSESEDVDGSSSESEDDDDDHDHDKAAPPPPTRKTRAELEDIPADDLLLFQQALNDFPDLELEADEHTTRTADEIARSVNAILAARRHDNNRDCILTAKDWCELHDPLEDVHAPPALRHDVAIYAAQRVARQANDKDIPWSSVVNTDDEQAAVTALEGEITNMGTFGFTQVSKDDPDYDKISAQARRGRIILARKRADITGHRRWKARAVELGHLSKSGADINIYSPVTPQEILRAVILFPGRFNPHPKGPRVLATVDVSQAYLQGDDRFAGYVKFKHPLTGEPIIIYLRCPIYGSDVAAKHWYNSQRKQLLRMGFVQGFCPGSPAPNMDDEHLRAPCTNCPCLFYHPGRDIRILVYVDDVLVDGHRVDLDWFFKEYQKRFQTTPVNWLTPDTPIDFCGIIISMDDTMLYMDMSTYISSAKRMLGIDAFPKTRLPLRADITNLEPLPAADHGTFLSMLGISHWLASTTSVTTKYAAARISQHMAKPNRGAFEAVKTLFHYHCTNPNLGLGVPLRDPDLAVGRDLFVIHVDADNSSNPETQNKRRAHYSNVMGYANSAAAIAATGGRASAVSPVIVNAKTLGIAVACKAFTESHAGVGSGENETYALANSINDALYFSYVVSEMGADFPMPFRLSTDATTAKVFAMGTAMRSRMKHIDQRQGWVGACRDARIVDAVYGKGEDNNADIGTKGYFKHPKQFEERRDRLQVRVPTTGFST